MPYLSPPIATFYEKAWAFHLTSGVCEVRGFAEHFGERKQTAYLMLGDVTLIIFGFLLGS